MSYFQQLPTLQDYTWGNKKKPPLLGAGEQQTPLYPQPASIPQQTEQPSLIEKVSDLGLPQMLPNLQKQNAAVGSLGNTPTVAEQPKQPGLYDYWKQPVFGKMPLDKFVQLAGLAAHALDPTGPGGRMGAGLAQMGGQAQQDRLGYEEREQNRKIAQEKEDYDRSRQDAEVGFKIAALKGLPEESKLTAYNSAIGHLNKYAFKDNPITPLTEWNDDANDVMVRMKAIDDTIESMNLPPDQAKQKKYEMYNRLRVEFPELNAPIGGVADVYKPPQEREVNVANEIDTILGGMFPGYYTDPTVRQKALRYYATPKGAKQVQTDAAEYAKSKLPPQYIPVPTSQGYQVFRSKGAKAGQFLPIPESGAPSKPLPESATKEFGAYAALMKNIQAVENKYKPNYVGPVSGRYYSLKEGVVGLPEQQTQFYALVRDNQDTLLRARSGAQINEQEYQRLKRFLPDPTDPPKTFKAKLNRYKDAVRNYQIEKAKTYSGQGYKIDISTGEVPKTSRNKAKVGRFTVEVE